MVFSNNAATHYYTFPDASGTVALTSDIPDFSSKLNISVRVVVLLGLALLALFELARALALAEHLGLPLVLGHGLRRTARLGLEAPHVVPVAGLRYQTHAGEEGTHVSGVGKLVHGVPLNGFDGDGVQPCSRTPG